jgi:hypothetical protein
MTALEELMLAGEALAEAVDDYRNLAQCYAPEREDFDSDEDFRFAVQCYEDDRKAAAARLGRAFRDYRCAQQRELSQRVIRSA